MEDVYSDKVSSNVGCTDDVGSPVTSKEHCLLQGEGLGAKNRHKFLQGGAPRKPQHLHPNDHSTPLNKNKSKKKKKRNTPGNESSPLFRQNYHHPTVEIDITSDELLKKITETKPSTPELTKNRTPGKNLLIESVKNGTPRPQFQDHLVQTKAYSPGYLPIFSPSSFCPTTPGVGGASLVKKPINITEEKDLNKDVLNGIMDAVRECITSWYEMSSEWQRYRVIATKHVEKFIAHMNEAMSSSYNSFSMDLVPETIRVWDTLREMSLLTSDLANHLAQLRNLGIHEKLYRTIFPFDNFSLDEILNFADNAHKLYRKEYLQKKEASSDLNNTCSVEVQEEECRDIINKTLSVWSNDIFVNKRDPVLLTMMREIVEC